jgi:hypothetical protein
LLEAIEAKQAFETYMIKTIITDFRSFPKELKNDVELTKAVDVVRERLAARQQELDQMVQKTLSPIKHKIVVTPAS